MTDYRKLYREGAMLLLEVEAENRLYLSPEKQAIIDQLRAIPKPGSAGGPKPGSGRKKKTAETK